MAVYQNAETYYRDWRALKQTSSFSKEWHQKYQALHARIPFPERKFGKRNRPDVDEVDVSQQPILDASGATSSKKLRVAGDIDPTTCVIDLTNAAPVNVAQPTHDTFVLGTSPLHREQIGDTQADVATEPWLHDLTDPPVFRFKAEYARRIEYLEKKLATFESGVIPSPIKAEYSIRGARRSNLTNVNSNNNNNININNTTNNNNTNNNTDNNNSTNDISSINTNSNNNNTKNNSNTNNCATNNNSDSTNNKINNNRNNADPNCNRNTINHNTAAISNTNKNNATNTTSTTTNSSNNNNNTNTNNNNNTNTDLSTNNTNTNTNNTNNNNTITYTNNNNTNTATNTNTNNNTYTNNTITNTDAHTYRTYNGVSSTDYDDTIMALTSLRNYNSNNTNTNNTTTNNANANANANTNTYTPTFAKNNNNNNNNDNHDNNSTITITNTTANTNTTNTTANTADNTNNTTNTHAANTIGTVENDSEEYEVEIPKKLPRKKIIVSPRASKSPGGQTRAQGFDTSSPQPSEVLVSSPIAIDDEDDSLMVDDEIDINSRPSKNRRTSKRGKSLKLN